MREELLAYGLSNKEISTYLHLIRAGSSTASQIADRTDQRRSTTYEILETLQGKGLISKYVQHKKYYFTANDPSALLEQLEEKKEKVTAILPQLTALANTLGEKPIIAVYHGLSGMRTAANQMLQAKEILIYGAGVLADELVGTFTANFAQKRLEKGIHVKSIVGTTVPEHMLQGKIPKVTEIRKNATFNDHRVTYFIYGDTVLIWTLGNDKFATSIKSALFAESQKSIFYALWNIS